MANGKIDAPRGHFYHAARIARRLRPSVRCARGRSPRILRFSSGGAIALLSSLAICFFTPSSARAQFDEPSEQLHISTTRAATWEHAGESVVALQGPVTIELDNATITARQAVRW